MNPVIIRIGARYGNLTTIEDGYKLHDCRATLCQCDCGTEIVVSNPKLYSMHTKSCGCLRGKQTKHGLRGHPLYGIWVNMKQRCENPNRSDFKYYGGRGITFCERWKDFKNFIADMGERPVGLTLDRINSNGNYEPTNCRWTTWTVQNNNQRPRYAQR